MIRTLTSIHDVTPDTLDFVEEIHNHCRAYGLPTITLLVIPAAGWSEASLERLRLMSQQGVRLAGHGWTHAVNPKQFKSIRAKLHSALVSRNVAEHLALDGEEIARLISDCYQWFLDKELAAPDLYVPPAWAMGSISRDALSDLPFRYYELLHGVYDSDTKTLLTMPLLGYEADTLTRECFLRLWNRINLGRAKRSGLLRIGIHPFDLSFRLGDELKESLQLDFLEGKAYADVF